VAPRYRSLGFKIGLRYNTVNRHQVEASSMSPTLLAAVVSLVAWAILAFGLALPSGALHLLLALGTTLLVRWWALRA
jgi:hypothetical protein